MSETIEEKVPEGDEIKHLLSRIRSLQAVRESERLAFVSLIDDMTNEKKENARLRTLLSTLMEAVEPFAEHARCAAYNDIKDTDLILVASVGSSDEDDADYDAINVGDLRRAREAYLKAKGE